MKVLVVDSIHPVLFDILKKQELQCIDASKWSDDEVFRELKTSHILIMRSRFSIDAAFIDHYPQLKIIGRVGSGIEHINQTYAMSKGIKILSSPEGNSQSVAEHAVGLLLSLFNKIVQANNQVKDGTWNRKLNQGIELQGKVVGIIGYGNTGSAFASILSGFGVKVLAYDKYLSTHDYMSTMDDIFNEADVVSLHLPLTEETKRMVNKNWINQFQKSFYFINTSRGQIVETADLYQGIESGKIAGACLDVLEFENEQLKMPTYSELPDFFQAFVHHPKVLITPHTAGLTVQSYEKLSAIMAEKILTYIKEE